MYVEILKEALLPFVRNTYPDGHKFMQDNDPKHTSLYARDWMEQTGLTWWKTPPESPDLNPIENLWHELKEYIWREIKPKVKQDLIDGILKFWRTVDVAKCINHLNKVIPKVIELYKWLCYRLLNHFYCTIIKINCTSHVLQHLIHVFC